MSLHELGVCQAAEGLAGKKFSSVELTQAVIDRVHEKDGEIGAYITFDEEGALAAAKTADEARAAGKVSPLLGVPVAIKDLINVKGQPCTCASKMLKGYTSPYDATVIKNLKAAGAVCAGRVNMDEFAMGSSTENSGLGVTRNPYDLSRVPGGSSGGSAAAVGGNLAIAALGTDTGGSIRQPASFCNIVGLKPSYGRVSRFGVTAFASSLDQVGPMTKSVDDAAMLLQVLAGHDEMDGTTPKDPVPDYMKAMEGASMKGVNLVADIGNGTMNVLYMVNGRPQSGKMYTEKFGTYQCTLAIREMFMQKTQREINDAIIEEVLCTGTAAIPAADIKIIRMIAKEYVDGIFRRLREHGYDEGTMMLYITGGGGCLVKNFGKVSADRVKFVDDICAAAKGYEYLAELQLGGKG